MEITERGGAYQGRFHLGESAWETMLDLRIEGTAISFRRTEGDQRYVGVISGNTIRGTFSQGGAGSYAWTATNPAASDVPSPSTKPPGSSEVDLFNSMNVYGVGNQPTAAATFAISRAHMITSLFTYHWNNGSGSTRAGTISLRRSDGTVYGPWATKGSPGQGGVPNASWEAHPNVVVPAGTYTIVDSSPGTWAQNTESGGRGHAIVKGYPSSSASTSSPEVLRTPPKPVFDLGRVWRVRQWIGNESWTWVWTRRGDSNAFDAVAHRNSDGFESRHVISFETLQGNTVTLSRPDANGNYIGTLSPDRRSIKGKTTFAGNPNEGWTAEIEGQTTVSQAQVVSPRSSVLQTGRYGITANTSLFEVSLTVSGSTFSGYEVSGGIEDREYSITNGIISGDTVTFHRTLPGVGLGGGRITKGEFRVTK